MLHVVETGRFDLPIGFAVGRKKGGTTKQPICDSSKAVGLAREVGLINGTDTVRVQSDHYNEPKLGKEVRNRSRVTISYQHVYELG